MSAYRGKILGLAAVGLLTLIPATAALAQLTSPTQGRSGAPVPISPEQGTPTVSKEILAERWQTILHAMETWEPTYIAKENTWRDEQLTQRVFPAYRELREWYQTETAAGRGQDADVLSLYGRRRQQLDNAAKAIRQEYEVRTGHIRKIKQWYLDNARYGMEELNKVVIDQVQPKERKRKEAAMQRIDAILAEPSPLPVSAPRNPDAPIPTPSPAKTISAPPPPTEPPPPLGPNGKPLTSIHDLE